MQPFDVAVGLRAPGADLGVRDAVGQSGAEGAAAELAAVVAEYAFELPAGVLELCGDAPGQCGGLLDGRARGGCDDQVGPRERAVGVDRGDLPDRALGAV